MLYTQSNSFNWIADNFGADAFDTAFGTAVTTGAANTKGSDTQIHANTVVSNDVYAVSVHLCGGRNAASQRTFLTDVKVDTAGGTSYVTKIPNLLWQQNIGGRCNSYYFPLFIPAGSSIAVATQCNAATITHRCGIRLYGKPTYPELIGVGTVVEAIGVDTTNTRGTSVTPNTGSWGTYTSLGTSSNDNWWWQCGLCVTDTTMSNQQVGMRLAGGDATNKKVLVPEIFVHSYTSEELFWHGLSYELPIQQLPASSTIYGSLYQETTADTGNYMAAYGMK